MARLASTWWCLRRAGAGGRAGWRQRWLAMGVGSMPRVETGAAAARPRDAPRPACFIGPPVRVGVGVAGPAGANVAAAVCQRPLAARRRLHADPVVALHAQRLLDGLLLRRAVVGDQVAALGEAASLVGGIARRAGVIKVADGAGVGLDAGQVTRAELPGRVGRHGACGAGGGHWWPSRHRGAHAMRCAAAAAASSTMLAARRRVPAD